MPRTWSAARSTAARFRSVRGGAVGGLNKSVTSRGSVCSIDIDASEINFQISLATACSLQLFPLGLPCVEIYGTSDNVVFFPKKLRISTTGNLMENRVVIKVSLSTVFW